MTVYDDSLPLRPLTVSGAMLSVHTGLWRLWLQQRGLGLLLVPWGHDRFLRQQRADLTLSRIRLLAGLFAVLVPLWIAVDLLAFDAETALAILPLRLAAAVALGLLAWPWPLRRPRRAAPTLLIGLLLVPPLFHLAASSILVGVDRTGVAGIAVTFYDYVPFTVIAGLSVFPLTALETAAAGLFVAAMMIVAAAQAADFSWTAQIGPIWLLLLLTGASGIAGMSQLNYLSILIRRVTFDPLTKALSRRAGMDLLDAKYRSSLMQDLPLTLVFVDLDRFKQINDDFGHEFGDRVLRQAANNIMACLRHEDALIRWGGEEFLIVLGGARKEGARRILSRMRKQGLGHRPTGTPITASFGVAERLADDAPDWMALIETADKRMYRAKLQGRDRVVDADD